MMSYHHDGSDVGSRVSGAAAAAAADKASDEKAPPLDLSHHFSFVSRNRLPNEMKKYYKLFQIPGIGNIAGGLPNVQFFPFDTLEAKTAKPERWEPTPNYPENENDSTCGSETSSSKSGGDPQASAKLAIPKILHETDITKKIDLETALQYGQAQGYPPLLTWVREFTRENLHPNVPYKDGPEVTLVCGSTDGFSKTLDVFVDAWDPLWHDIRDRPGLLCEEIVYPGILSQSRPRGVQIVPVRSDEHGMLAYGEGSLEDVLKNWNADKGRRPHLMYTVTLGHNPSGRVLPMERRKQLYTVCSKYDVIIVEDEPYWYLQYPSAAVEEAKSRGQPLPIEEVPSGDDDDESLDSFRPSSLQVDSVYWHREYLSSAIEEVKSRVRGHATEEFSPEKPRSKKVSSGYEFLDSLQPSFLSVDTDGRVVRLDTFSKTIAPGCRLGWVTAAPAIIEKFIGVSESSTQQPSGFVQAMVAQLIMGPQEPTPSTQKSTLSLSSLFGVSDSSIPVISSTSSQGWKKDGWVRWLEGLRGQYERRVTRMCRILDSGSSIVRSSVPASRRDSDCLVITKTLIFDYSWPRGGMFVWVRLLFETHPLWQAPWQSFVPPAAASFCSSSSLISFCQEQRKQQQKRMTEKQKQQQEKEKQKQDPALIGGPSLSAALMLYLTQKPHLVLVSTGALFSANETIAAQDGWRYFRLCFAAVSEEDVDATSKRFVDGVHAFWRVKDPRVIKKLLEPITGGKSAATTAVSLSGEDGVYTAEEEGMESIVTRKMVGLDVTGKMGC